VEINATLYRLPSEKTLAEWADKLARGGAGDTRAYWFFDNDQDDQAPRDAQRLLKRLRKRMVSD
jgi:uncharacterized protein YecE (DUF72 family)